MKKLTPFNFGWWSIDLGKYRPHPTVYSTYSLFSYADLPPLPEQVLRGKLQWLEHEPLVGQNFLPFEPEESYREWDDEDEDEDGDGTNEQELMENLHRIVDSARQLGLSLPDPFLRLMTSVNLRNTIPSCTACFFDLPEEIVPCPGSEEGYIIRFLNDQQWCLMWYLYVTPKGEHCVLVSPYVLEEFADPDFMDTFTMEIKSEILEATFVCAPSFETFLYRFYIENHIRFKLYPQDGPMLLTEEEKRYIAHYSVKSQ